MQHAMCADWVYVEIQNKLSVRYLEIPSTRLTVKYKPHSNRGFPRLVASLKKGLEKNRGRSQCSVKYGRWYVLNSRGVGLVANARISNKAILRITLYLCFCLPSKYINMIRRMVHINT